MQEKKIKEPLVAVILSCVLLGLGHIYAGRLKLGFVLIASYIGALLGLLLWMLHPTANLRFLSSTAGNGLLTIGFFETVVFVMVMVILFHAYRCAKLHNVKNNLERRITASKRIVLILGVIVTYLGLNIGFPLVLAARTYAAQAFKIPSGAMRPTLIEDDRLLVYKFAYKNAKPERGDIAVFVFPPDPSRDFIKRVIAKDGEFVEIRDGDIYINDKLVEMPVVKNIYYYNGGDYGAEGQKIQVPDGQYFVLGDNSATSRDSRYWGFVPEENFVGKAYKIYYPFNRSGPIE